MAWWGERRSGGAADLGLDLRELAAALGSGDAGGNLSAAVDNCGVVAVAEEVADLLEGELGILAEDVHGDMSCLSDRLSTAGALQAGYG